MQEEGALNSTTQRFISSLKYGGYRRLFLSTSFAGLANWTLLVARGWLAFHLTGSSTWVGVVTFAGFAPFLLGPLGGVLADRYPRQFLAAASTAAGALFSLALAVLALTDVIAAWHLAVITLLMSLPRAAELPARQSLIANVVPNHELLNAVSLTSVATFGTRALGPALVVPMIDSLGAGEVFLLAAGFYLLATLTVASIKVTSTQAPARAVNAIQSLAEALRFVIQTPSVSALMLLVVFHCALTMSFDSLLPSFAVQHLHSDGASFGVMATGVGLGALVGTFLVGGLRTKTAQGRMLLATAVLSGITPMAMALPMEVMTLGVATFSTFAMGATQGAFMALSGALVQIAAPDELRGRVSSFYLLSAGGLMAWVNLINGALADIWHVPLLFLVPAVAYLLILVLLTRIGAPLRDVFRSSMAAAAS